MASKILSVIANTFSGLGRDFQHGLDLAREHGADIFPDASAPHATNRVESDTGLTPSIERDVLGNEASDSAMSASRLSLPEAQISSNALKVFQNAHRGFADVDNQLLKAQHKVEVDDSHVSEVSQSQTAPSAEISQTISRENSHTPTLSSADVWSIVRKSKEESAETRASPELEVSINSLVESRLHAAELLTPNIRQWLQAMFTALILQLSCCDNKHFIRLKLTGFVNPFDDKSRPSFDLYLSTGQDGMRSRWIESKCTFIRLVLQATTPIINM